MKKRRLGNSGIEVAPLALGGNVFGWTADEATSFRVLDAFVDAGCNLIDTADVYSVWVPGHLGGESETVIGNWLKRSGRRKDVVIATKVGNVMSAEKKGLSKAYILRAVEDSLRRLQTDSIDLYQSHVDDPATPVEETLETYAELVRSGKTPGDRRFEFYGRTIDAIAGGEQAARLSELRELAAALQSCRAGGLRGESGAGVRGERNRRDSLLRAGQRIFDRQVSVGGGSFEKRAWVESEEVS